MSKSKIAVIGAGLMGHGIAYIFAAAGTRVSIYDPNKLVLDSVKLRISEILKLLEQPLQILDNIYIFDNLENAVEKADVVIEAVPEQIDIKKALFEKLILETSQETILATNTSGIPIEQIARDTKEPHRILGTHFWNPPHLIPLVEVIQSQFTDPSIIQRMLDLLSSVGKTAVHVKKDIPGFIGNRLQHALKREAISLVQNGVCDAETVDLVVKEGFGMRLSVMGPLENSDLVGLNLTLDIHQFLLPDLDTSTKPQELLKNKVQAGELGMSVGQGFRSWTPEKAKEAKMRMWEYLLKAAKERLSK